MKIFSTVAFALAAADDCEYYNKVTSGVCADDCVPATLGLCPRSLIVTEGGLTAGTCKSLGYTVDKGELDQKAGPCGTLKFEQYAKASIDSPADSKNMTVLATFDGARGTTFKWRATNDPVMGGKSTSTFTIDDSSSTGKFVGTCAIVPSLKAPGNSRSVFA